MSEETTCRVEGDGWANWSELATMFGEFGNSPALNRVLAVSASA